MVSQATMNGNGRSAPGGLSLGPHLSQFAHDLTTLIELQSRLLLVDLRDARRASTLAIAILVGSGIVALGSVPVILFAAAHALIEFAQWPASASYAAVGIGAAVLGAGGAWLGWKRLMSAGETLTRSREELQETLKWLKRALHSSSHFDEQQFAMDESTR